ncbi:PQQ-binding-like beta-propeller repeat protein [Natrinema halophilum]|uniref:PQQ-binding-like beta-propeller repeat protein n=1 Tax=Natrinema halophilum TaxID=1699371 RepID=A0A7D5HAU9_9EURY|nr:PQQ-binding-like beta-propeller repeat protein [Natrinema halophilum]QLG50955.1 PQQ-binding-like beta-propeller repeat protein [Natrinema halophilum]
MSRCNRRGLLITGAGATIAGGVLTGGDSVSASSGERCEDSDGSEDPNALPETDRPAGWMSYRGNEANTSFFETGGEFDGDTLEVAWTADRGSDTVAVADDTIYIGTGDGIHARTVTDGSVKWESNDVCGSYPVVADETIYAGGDGEIVALDPSDGSRRWHRDLGAEFISAPTVAYGAIYVTVDGTLYALETDDGSSRWTRELYEWTDNTGSCDEPPFRTAAANELLYFAAIKMCFALDPMTGETVDRFGGDAAGNVRSVAANSNAIAIESTAFGETDITVYDSRTKEALFDRSGTHFALGDDIAVITGQSGAKAVDIESCETLHQWSGGGTRPVIVGETIYTYLSSDSGAETEPDSIVALDKTDGTEKWRFDMDRTDQTSQLAISEETIYLVGDETVMAIRETSHDGTTDDGTSDDDSGDGSKDSDGSDGSGDGSSDRGGSGGDSEDSDGTGGSGDDSKDSDGSGDSGTDSKESDGTGGNSNETEGSADDSGNDSGGGANQSGAPSETGSTGSFFGDVNPLGAITGLAVMAGGAALASRRLITNDNQGGDKRADDE